MVSNHQAIKLPRAAVQMLVYLNAVHLLCGTLAHGCLATSFSFLTTFFVQFITHKPSAQNNP